jgi:hypothetical protein
MNAKAFGTVEGFRVVIEMKGWGIQGSLPLTPLFSLMNFEFVEERFCVILRC